MKRYFFGQTTTHRRCFCIILSIFAMTYHLTVWGLSNGDGVTEKLAKLGFENVRWTENESERIYAIENIAYKIQETGISKEAEHLKR